MTEEGLCPRNDKERSSLLEYEIASLPLAMTKKEAVIARDKVPKQSHWDCLAPLAMTARLCFAGIGEKLSTETALDKR